MHVTVGICTWNRAPLLDLTLAALAKLRIPNGVSWEVLVVNNNSSDHTDLVLERHAKAVPLRRLFQPVQGKSNAANLLVAEAAGEYVLWTDDDALVEPDWMAAYLRAAADHPEAAFFGGTVNPLYEGSPPRWVARNLDLLQGPFALRAFGPETRSFAGSEAPFGNNMAFRTADLKAVGFDPKLGRIGTALLHGEETAVVEQLKANGRPGLWVGGAVVRHHIPANRMTPGYVWRFFYGMGRTRQRVTPYDRDVALLAGAPRWVWKKYVLASLASRCAAPTRSRWWLTSLIDAAVHRGILDECRRREPAAWPR